MALTQSTMMELGSIAPSFSLPATHGETVSLDQFKNSEALVVLFICNHCPYVVHIAGALTALAAEYQKKGVAFVAISSNDIEAYPADNLECMEEEKEKWQYTFPYALDETQAVAKAYGAACTPDIYVFDGNQKLAYRGQFDDTRPNRISSGNYDSGVSPATGENLKHALNAVLQGGASLEQQVPSMGCNIKWKAGNEPEYF